MSKVANMARTIFTGGRIFRGSQKVFHDTMIVDGDQIEFVGSRASQAVQRAIQQAGMRLVDLGGRVVLPGFIDGHVHLLNFGLNMQRLDLLACRSLQDVQDAIKTYASANPTEPRILCRNWLQQATTNGIALASMLDGLDKKSRPIFVEAADLHSTWCNTAAMKEMGVTDETTIPGDGIQRDDDGHPSGLFSEVAQFGIIHPHVASVTSLKKKLAALESAIQAYTAAGYTGAVDMAMDDEILDVLMHLRSSEQYQNRLPLHLAMYWLVPWSGDQDQHLQHVDRAIALRNKFNRSDSPDFYIAGIKLILDGVVDGCTAALRQPYGNLSSPVDPIWASDELTEVVRYAETAGLQCAIHAIGDAAITQAIDAIASAREGKSNNVHHDVVPVKRHRIEHLELSTPEDARRLGALGITASVQPVHTDPVLFTAWPRLLGESRCGRAFAYREFLDGGAPLALGTDAPTAAHLPLPNLYHATTRRSTIDKACTETTNEQFAISLAEATTAATSGAAYSTFAEERVGSLEPGKKANFVLIDVGCWSAEHLLQARVVETWYEGEKIFGIS